MKRSYEHYVELEKLGVPVKWDEIGYEELYQLWGREGIPDSMIADLFDVKIQEVTKKRHRLHIKQENVSTKETWIRIVNRMEEMPAYETHFEPYQMSDRVKIIISKIEELSHEEKNALILALTRTSVFEDIFTNAEYWYRLNGALDTRGGSGGKNSR